MADIANQLQNYFLLSPLISSQSFSNYNSKELPLNSQVNPTVRWEKWTLLAICILESKNKQEFPGRMGKPGSIKGTVGENRSRQSALVRDHGRWICSANAKLTHLQVYLQP